MRVSPVMPRAAIWPNCHSRCLSVMLVGRDESVSALGFAVGMKPEEIIDDGVVIALGGGIRRSLVDLALGVLAKCRAPVGLRALARQFEKLPESFELIAIGRAQPHITQRQVVERICPL